MCRVDIVLVRVSSVCSVLGVLVNGVFVLLVLCEWKIDTILGTPEGIRVLGTDTVTTHLKLANDRTT